MPSHDPTKLPTDAAILKAFSKYEEGYNVFMAVLRHAPEKLDQLYTGLNKEDLANYIQFDKDAISNAHNRFRALALAAHARIEADKAAKDKKQVVA